MKRYLSAIATLALAIGITSCAETITSSDDEIGYSDIYPGAVLYSEAVRSTALATDGLNVALRLAILIAEMEEEELSFTTGSSTEPDWSALGTFFFSSNGYESYVEYVKKSFLLGEDDQVVILNPSTNVYTVRYGDDLNYHTQALYDELYRKGGYTITTNGENLSQTGAIWNIEISDSVITFATEESQEDELYSVSKISTTITNTGEGYFSFEVESILKESYQWDIIGSLYIDSYRDLTITSTVERDYELTIESAMGTSLSGYSLTYTTVEPLIYNISELEYDAIGGEEKVVITDGDTSTFPDSTVIVETNADASKNITYDGKFWEQ